MCQRGSTVSDKQILQYVEVMAQDAEEEKVGFINQSCPPPRLPDHGPRTRAADQPHCGRDREGGGRNALGVSSRGAQGNPGEPGGSGRRVTWREGASVSKSIS